VVLEASSADLGALQILQDTDRPVFQLRGAAQPRNIPRMLRMGSMGKIQPGYVHAQLHHFAQAGFRIARRPDGADNLGAARSCDGGFR